MSACHIFVCMGGPLFEVRAGGGLDPNAGALAKNLKKVPFLPIFYQKKAKHFFLAPFYSFLAPFLVPKKSQLVPTKNGAKKKY